MGQVLGAAGAVGTPLEDFDTGQLEQCVVQRGGHLAGAAAVAGDRLAVHQHISGLIAQGLLVGAHIGVEVQLLAGLHDAGEAVAGHGDVDDAALVDVRLHHRIIGSVGGDGAVVPQGLVGGGDGDQVGQVVEVDIAVGAPVRHDGPAVLDLPDAEHGTGVEHDPAFVIVAHGLAHLAHIGSGGDVEALLHAVGRGVDGIHRRHVIDALALDVADIAVLADNGPVGAHVQHVGGDGAAVALHALGLGIPLGVGAGIGHDVAGIQRGGGGVEVLAVHFLVRFAHHDDGLVLIIGLIHALEFVQLLLAQLGPGHILAGFLSQRHGQRRQHQADSRRGRQHTFHHQG